MTGKTRTDAERDRQAESRHALDSLRQWFDQAPGFVALLRGRDLVFELVNRAYYQLVGHRDILGKPAFEALPDLRGQGFEERLRGVMATGQPFVGRAMRLAIQREPGAPLVEAFIDLTYAPVFDADGTVSGIFAQGYDVTERHHAMQALRSSEARARASLDAAERKAAELRAVLESMPDAVYIGGLQGITLANRVALDQLGFATQEELNRHVGVLAEEIQTRDWESGAVIPVERQAFTRALGGERVVQDVLVRHRLSHEERIVRCAAAPVVIDGQVIGAVAVNTDVTEQRRAEASLREADARKDEFLAMLAHELRNPLTPLTNALRILERTEPLTERGRSVLAVADRQRGQLARLVDDLLEVSRITRGTIELRPEPMLVATVVHAAVEARLPGIEARGQSITVSLPEQPVRIVADPARITQVLDNLLANAKKFTPEGGAIRIEVEHDAAGVEIRVIDNGIGMTTEGLSKLFGLFSQVNASLDRAQGGLGIGLAMVKRLVELHGGSVVAASAGLGKGSTFAVRLPRRAPA